MIIGLTGGIGSGKSTVAALFRELGVFVVDADDITRQLVAPREPAFTEIVQHFGPKVLNPEGTLNRAHLRSLIFKSKSERLWLENLLHPLVKKVLLQLTAKLPTNQYAVIAIPLLIEANFEAEVDRILVVDCTEAQQIERAIKRDPQMEKTILSIIKSQTTRSKRLSLAQDVIDNTGTLEALKRKVLDLHQNYIKLFNQ